MKKLFFLLFAVINLVGYSQSYIDKITSINSMYKGDKQEDICISPDKKYMAIATLTTIKVMDVRNFKVVRIIPVDFKRIYTISIDGNNVMVVGSRKDGLYAENYSWLEKRLVKQVNLTGGKSYSYYNVVKSTSYIFFNGYGSRKLNIIDCNSLDPIRTIPISEKGINGITVSNDESMVAFTPLVLFTAGNKNLDLYVYNVKDGTQKYTHQFSATLLYASFNKSNELIVTAYNEKVDPNNRSVSVYKVDKNFSDVATICTKTGYLGGEVFICSNENFIAFQGGREHSTFVDDPFNYNMDVLFLDDCTWKTVASGYNYLCPKGALAFNYKGIKLSDELFLLPVNWNFNTIINIRTKQLVGYFYHRGNGVAFISPDGRFTGDNEAISNIMYDSYRSSYRKDILLTNQIDQFYTPKLFQQVLCSNCNVEINLADINKVIKFTPDIKIVSPDSISEQKANSVNVRYDLSDNGDGIKEVRFYINGKLINNDNRGFKAVGDLSQEVPLLTGENIIEAVALSNSGYQSSPDRVIVKYKGAEAFSNLYVLGIGIDQYKNSRYNLNYAFADVTSITDYIKTNGVGIFKNIDVKLLTNQEATKSSIIQELDRIAQHANETDVFLLYYAGHGVMSEGSADVPRDYFMVLNDVSQMYGNDDLLSQKGLSAAELREFCKKIKAQKQVVLLDACQSGGATETFAMRGASEEKAIIQLAQSTGVFLISSTGTEQFASEFGELKHGVFSYALLEGLKGAADGGGKDGKITIKELEAYLNDRIPELTQKYRGSMQFPNTWSRGMDFPIVVVGM
ncbi:hypothetical protein CYCD_24150 [Tenuifilaceae bacterium CYCD]|nr:hypothetical protein CYCD_24150 [Tenuifilaceae bacterium CYCD]